MNQLLALVPVLAAVSLVLPGRRGVRPAGARRGASPGGAGAAMAAPPGPYDELLLVVDLAPGTAFPDHAHGGPVFVSVVEGALWERSGGRETTLRAGETLYEETGRVHDGIHPFRRTPSRSAAFDNVVSQR